MLTFHKTCSQPLPNWLGSWSINSNSQVLQLKKSKLNKLVQIENDVYICCCASIYYLESRWWFQTFFIFTPKIGEDEPILTSIFFKWVGSTTNQLRIFPSRNQQESNPKVIKVAIEPLQPAELPKMVDGLRCGKRKGGENLDEQLARGICGSFAACSPTYFWCCCDCRVTLTDNAHV